VQWDDYLAFRNALSGNADLRRRYIALKQDLAARHANDRLAYTMAKDAFIRGELERLQ
jgi:GrpB-like predicted nucleotidyltransferase (UPF0157 family)